MEGIATPEPTVPEALRVRLEALLAEAAARGGELALSLRHLERGDRYDHAAAEPFAAASTIKVPILVALYDAAARGAVALDRRLRLRAEDQVTGSGVLQVCSPGLRLPLRDLAELMIVVSDNTATNMIVECLGIDAINACLERLGLRQTRLVRTLQVIPAGAVGVNTATAGEMADLLALIARGQAVSWDACRRMVATLKRQQQRDALPALLPEATAPLAPLGTLPAWEFAHKTGAITGHRHDVGILYLPGQSIVLCVLTRDCGPGRRAGDLIARVGLAVWETYRSVSA